MPLIIKICLSCRPEAYSGSSDDQQPVWRSGSQRKRVAGIVRERSILPEVLHIKLWCYLFFIINFSLLFYITARENSCSTIFYPRKWRWWSWWWLHQWETIQKKWCISPQQSIKVILKSLVWEIFYVLKNAVWNRLDSLTDNSTCAKKIN